MRKRFYIQILIFIIFLSISFQPVILETIEQDLANHMAFEHTLFFVLGAMSIIIAESILRLLVELSKKRGHRISIQGHSNNLLTSVTAFWKRILRNVFSINRYGFIWVLISVIILAFWHLPTTFDFAALNGWVHILQHLSFTAVGAIGVLSIRAIGESYSIFLLVFLSGIMGFLGLMFSVLDKPVYHVYSVAGHNNAGIYLIASCMLLLFIVLPAYLINRTLFHIRIRREEMKRKAVAIPIRALALKKRT